METELLKQSRHHFSKLGLMYFFGTLLIYGVQFLAGAVAGMINPALLADPDLSLLISMLPMYALAMPLMALLIRRVPASQLPRHTLKLRQLLPAFLMSYALMYCSNIVGQFITIGIGILKGKPVANVLLNITVDLNPMIAFLVMVLLAPVAEELIFRKLLVDRVCAYGESTAILLSGFLFALFHGNLNQFAYAFTIGLFLAFLYVKTGRVLYPILLHMAINFLGSILSLQVMKWTGFDRLAASLSDPAAMTDAMMANPAGMIGYYLYALALIGITLAGIILFCIHAKKFTCRPGEIELPKNRRCATVLLNPGMILFILFWTVQIVLQLFL